MKRNIVLLLGLISAFSLTQAERWSVERANAWYAEQPWLVGCNFLPSTAVNELEMWQAETFDPVTIDRELGWAAGIGMNSVRVFINDLVWKADPDGFKQRFERFLEIADSHGISVMPVIFDACFRPNAQLGPQQEPVPGVHNGRWVQSPPAAVLRDQSQWGYLEEFAKDIISTYANDPRIVVWDLYNEPGNGGHGDDSIPLLKAVFEWAREVNPSQPLTSGVWNPDFSGPRIIDLQLALSDVISFHDYRHLEFLIEKVEEFRKYGRPILCTEYMGRTRGSWFETSLLLFSKHKIGAYNWGLVSGRTQTIFPWRSPPHAAEPMEWFHDIFRPDGTPYNRRETEFIRLITSGY